MTGQPLLEGIFEAVSLYYNYTMQAECLDINKQGTASLGDKGWDYQVSPASSCCCPYVQVDGCLLHQVSIK